VAVAPALPAVVGACRRGPAVPLLTYFYADQALSLQYPATWRTEQAQHEGVWYRYFLSPADPATKSLVTSTLVAASLNGPLEDYAQSYVAGKSVTTSRDEERDGARGKSYRFRSPDGGTDYSLLLVQEEGRAYGLFSQGPQPTFDAQRRWVEEMERSFRLERPGRYPERRNETFGFSIRVPPSWSSNRTFNSGTTYLAQFTSPPLGADRNQTVHASLTLTVEPVANGGDVEAYYEATRKKLGSSFEILNHVAWKGGYADLMRTETPVAESRVKRFYRAAGGRGYSLAFEVREDNYSRVSRWCDMIAGTLKVGPEASAR
jgi:hypothetical protein